MRWTTAVATGPPTAPATAAAVRIPATQSLRRIQPQRGHPRFPMPAGKLEHVRQPHRGVVGALDRHVDVPVGRPGGPVQVAVDADGPDRYLQQRLRASAPAAGAVAHIAVRQVLWKPTRRNAGTSRSWLPRTRRRSPGHSATSSTNPSSRQASGWPTSPRQMMVSPSPTRPLQFQSRCRFISSTLRNGRPQPSSTDESDRCRSDQLQVRPGALATRESRPLRGGFVSPDVHQPGEARPRTPLLTPPNSGLSRRRASTPWSKFRFSRSSTPRP